MKNILNKQIGILDGIRVIDLTRMLSGPYCTMVLADHGAEVIKIEDDNGDTSRRAGPYRIDDKEKKWAGYFVSLNRNKKSIQLNLKKNEEREKFYDLIKKSHVLVENFRPGVAEKLGISYEILSKLNPKLVYGSIRGFGDPRLGESPYKNWPSYDVVAQAMGGIVSMTGTRKKPLKVGPGIGDIFAGSLLAFGLISALRYSEKTGKGQFVDVAMYDAMVSLCERGIYQYTFDSLIPQPSGNRHPFLSPFGIYKVKDGHIALGIVEDNFWKTFLNIMKKTKFLEKKKFSTVYNRSKNTKKINKIVSKWLKDYTKNDLKNMLGGLIPFGPVNNIKEIFHDEHIKKREMIFEVPHNDKTKKPWLVSASPVKFSISKRLDVKTAPKLGEHNFLLNNINICSDTQKLSSEFNEIFLFENFLISFLDNKNFFHFFIIDDVQSFFDGSNMLTSKIESSKFDITLIKKVKRFNLNAFDKKKINKKDNLEFLKNKKNLIFEEDMIPKFINFEKNFSFEIKQFVEIKNSLYLTAQLKGINIF